MIAAGNRGSYALAEKLGRNRRQILMLATLAVMQVTMLALVGFVQPPTSGPWEWARGIVVGVIIGSGFSAVSLAAAWAALGPFRPAVRIPCALCWALLTGLLILFNIVTDSRGGSRAAMEGTVLAASFASFWLILQIPFWITRSIFRLKLIATDERENGLSLAEHQFGIRQLLIVTAAIAVTLGVGRLLVLGIHSASDTQRVVTPDAEFLILLALFAGSQSLVAFIVITGGLLPARRLLPFALGFAVTLVITFLECVLITMMPRGPGAFWQVLPLITTMNVVQFSWLWGSLLVLRAADFRIVSG